MTETCCSFFGQDREPLDYLQVPIDNHLRKYLTIGWGAQVTKKISMLLALAGIVLSTLSVAQQPVSVEVVRAAAGSSHLVYDGYIEAVTETRIAAQVSGVIEQVKVSAGDRVQAGQILLQIDATHAKQQQAALTAHVEAARAELHALTQELQRQQQLYQKKYISKAALERIEAQQRAAAAQFKAQKAQAQAAQVATDFFIIRAPYAGVVIDVPAMQGDMAMPGMPLLSLFAPSALRVSVAVPASAAPHSITDSNQAAATVRVTQEQHMLTVQSIQRLPTIDRSTDTVRLWIAVANSENNLFPGQHVKVQLQQAAGGQDQRLFIPQAAVVQRAELTAVYVLNEQQQLLLRQVQLGVKDNDLVEVRSGLSQGERVVLNHAVLRKD